LRAHNHIFHLNNVHFAAQFFCPVDLAVPRVPLAAPPHSYATDTKLRPFWTWVPRAFRKDVWSHVSCIELQLQHLHASLNDMWRFTWGYCYVTDNWRIIRVMCNADRSEHLTKTYTAYILIIISQKGAFFQLYFGKEPYIFRIGLLSIIRSLVPYTQQ